MGKIKELIHRLKFWILEGWRYLKEYAIKAWNYLVEKFPWLKDIKFSDIKGHPYYKKAKPYIDKAIERYHRHKKRFWILVCILAALYILPKAFYMIIGIVEDEPMPVGIVMTEQETVPMYLEYVGTLESVRNVDIRARVEGFLIEKRFVEGSNVKKGQVLFVIDPSQYRASLNQAIGQLEKDRASLAFATEQVVRYEKLLEKDYGSKEQFDSIKAQAEEAAAAVAADEAAVEQARINLGYCTMIAPFAGRVGRKFVDVGNLVGAGQDTKLTTLVQLDPIYAYFSPSESDYRQINKYSKGRPLDVKLYFSDGSEHPHVGKLNFMNNVVDSGTSTITMRATIPNPDSSLLPGIYSNVRVKLTETPNAILIPEEAIGEDQSGKYVYAVNKDNKVEHKIITTGEKYDKMREITKGLEANTKVIVKGLQYVKPGMPVTPKIIKDANGTTSQAKKSKSSKKSSKKGSKKGKH